MAKPTQLTPQNKPADQGWFFNSGTKTDTTAELYFYGNVSNTDYSSWADDGIFTNQVRQTLQEVRGKELTIHINSYGGDVYGGYAIYSLIKQHDKKVTAVIDGVAMSAASVIALAADEVKMSEAAVFMIHNVWTVAMGDSNALREKADYLDKIGVIANDIYAKKTGKTAEEIKQLMDAETYFTAEEALAAGFVDEILQNEKQLSAQMSGDKLIWGGVDVTQFKDKLNLAKLMPQSQQNLALQLSQSAQQPIINKFSGEPSMLTNQVDNQQLQAAANPQLDLSLADLKSKYPAVYQAAVNEERERIQAIDELAEAGHEELINQAKYLTFMSAGDFAIALAKANKAKIIQQQQDYVAGVQASGVNNITGVGIAHAHAGIEQPNANSSDEAEVKLFQSVAHLVK